MTCRLFVSKVLSKTQNILYTNRGCKVLYNYTIRNTPRITNISYNSSQVRYISSDGDNKSKVDSPSQKKDTVPVSPEPLSLKTKLKRAVAEYGSTVIVFHVGISLVSLGTCYLLVSSGIDMGKILTPLGASGSLATNAGTFVTAYAIHKIFAPVRISITLGATPFIVRYLRNIGILKRT